MRLRLLIPACVLAPQVAVAQHESQWRFGAALIAPTRLISVTSPTAPDSGFGRVDLGIGLGVNAAHIWHFRSGTVGLIQARVMSAAVRSQAAGVEWSPGRALVVEATAGAQRNLGERAAVYGGITASHWSGPKQTAPFSGVGAVLPGAEAGVSMRPGGGPWLLDIVTNMTRFGADEAHGVATGFVWRWMVGVRRDR